MSSWIIVCRRRDVRNAMTSGEGPLDQAPLRSRFGNALTAMLVRSLHPGAPADTQCGFRALTRETPK